MLALRLWGHSGQRGLTQLFRESGLKQNKTSVGGYSAPGRGVKGHDPSAAEKISLATTQRKGRKTGAG